MRYAQYHGGNKLHLVATPGEEDASGAVVRYGYLSWPLCGTMTEDQRGRKHPHYRMTINMPLGHSCAKCRAAYARMTR